MRCRKRDSLYEKISEMEEIEGRKISRVRKSKINELYFVEVTLSPEHKDITNAFIGELESYINMEEWFYDIEYRDSIFSFVIYLYLPECLEIVESE